MQRFTYAEDLLDKLVPIDQVRQHPRNANNGDVDAIRDSIIANTFIEAIVVQRSTGYIVSGNHRYQVAIELGATEIPVTWVDCTDEQALRILVGMNRTSRLGQDDPALVLELLDEIKAEEEWGLRGTGYSDQQVEWLRETLEGPLNLEQDEEYAKQRSAHTCVCPKCGWRSDEKQRSTEPEEGYDL